MTVWHASMAMSPRSQKLQEEIEAEYQKEVEESAGVAEELQYMESSSDEVEEEADASAAAAAAAAAAVSLRKRKRELEKGAELKVATKEVAAIFDDTEKADKIAEMAKKLAHWKRTARRLAKEVYRIKKSCSCGRAVNYPYIFRK